MKLLELADALRRGEDAPEIDLIKRSPVRVVARCGDAVLKLSLRRPQATAREVRSLERAAALGLPVPVLLESGPDWLATRYVAARAAQRSDYPVILPLIERMHECGMLHGDLHLGNVLIAASGPLLLDVQKARFAPWLPAWLRRRELGYFAFSLDDPLPPEFASVRSWRDRRAQRHWRSRTRRCLVESSAFTAFRDGFRRRSCSADDLERALEALDRTEPAKVGKRAILTRSGGFFIKQFDAARDARRAWVNGLGLEVRGVSTGLAVAWTGRTLIMRDAGETLDGWVEREFDGAGAEQQAELARALGQLLARLHRRGIYHADLKANNVIWSPGAPPSLLDYGSVTFGSDVGLRRRIKNLAQLNAALSDRVPGSLREKALTHYLDEAEFSGDARRLREHVIAESLRRNHLWTGC